LARVFTDGSMKSNIYYFIIEKKVLFLNKHKNSSNSIDSPHCATYEGEVFNGKRHGMGTFKSGNNPVIYEGEWNLGRRYGKVFWRLLFYFI
jgi:hypothetical protein